MSIQRSSIADWVIKSVLRYKRKLLQHFDDESPEIILHYLTKLEKISLDINILQETGIRKVVKHLKKCESTDESVVVKARAVLSKWKEIKEQAMRQPNLANEKNHMDEKLDELVKK